MTKLFISFFLRGILLLSVTLVYALPKDSSAILILGDSLSAAYGIDQQQGWVALLQQRLAKDYPHYQVINSSIDGNTSSEGLSRLPELLKKYQPTIVLLELGANDGLRGLPIASIQANLAQMIEQCQQQSAQVLLLGMYIPPNYGPLYTTQFHAIYGDLAARYQIPLVDFLLQGVGDNQALKQKDMLHPDAAAQPQILENVWPKLQTLLKK